MSSPHAIISLVTILCAPVLAACSDLEWTRAINLLNGQIDTLQDEQTTLLSRISELRSGDDVDEQELASLRQQLSELGNRLESLGNPPYAPDLVSGPSVAYSEPEPVPEPPSGPAYNTFGYTGPEPCPGSVFSVLTCDDDGVSWHWLGPNREWVT